MRMRSVGVLSAFISSLVVVMSWAGSARADDAGAAAFLDGGSAAEHAAADRDGGVEGHGTDAALLVEADAATGQLADAGAADASSVAAIAPLADGGPNSTDTTSDSSGSWSDQLRALLDTEGAQTALMALLGLFVFLAGWPVARLLAAGASWLTSRITQDPKLAAMLGIEPSPAPPDPSGTMPPPLSITAPQLVSRLVYFLVMAVALLAGLHVSGLTAVSEPLDRFLRATSYGLPLVGRAMVILAISYVAARLLKTAVTRGLMQLRVDERLRDLSRRQSPPEPAMPAVSRVELTAPDQIEVTEQAAQPAAEPAPPELAFSEQVGLVTYWLVLAFGLAATIESLEFVPMSEPLQDALDRVIVLLPSIGTAALILAGGYLLGRMARKIVSSLLESAGFDRLIRRFDIGRTFEHAHPSALVGLAAMVFVLVEAAIAALNQLGLTGMSAPLTAAVTQVGAALPFVGLAALILLVGHFLGRYARTWTENAVTEVRVDVLLERIGVLKPPSETETPSSKRVLGTVAYWLIILLAAQQAFDAAGLTVWSGHISAFLAFIFQKLAVAAIIVLIGFAVATWARKYILTRQIAGPDLANWMAGVVRLIILVFAITMAIQHLGVADRFVTMAFAFAFGGLCLALALAFGMGGKETASDLLRRLKKD